VAQATLKAAVQKGRGARVKRLPRPVEIKLFPFERPADENNLKGVSEAMMNKKGFLKCSAALVLLVACAGEAAAQGGAAARTSSELTRVMVSGEATVQAQPDTAVLSIAVVTQNASASEAQAENASKTDAVVRALRAAAGANAEVKTGGYSLQPQYAYRPNESPQITGYQARNSVVVTMSELNRVGAVLDAASRAGANTVDNLSFTLRKDRPARSEALTEATRDAMAKARTVAEALGGRVVRVVEVQEGGFYRPPVPIPYARGAGGEIADAKMMQQTPIEVGSLDIRAQVQLVVEIEAKP
jgi:uncharacterized protein YggE